MSPQQRNPVARYVGGATLATITLLAAYYRDRAIFDEHREGIKTQSGWPLVGNLPLLLQYKDQIHDFLLEGFTALDDLTLYVLPLVACCLLIDCIEPCLRWVFRGTLLRLTPEMSNMF